MAPGEPARDTLPPSEMAAALRGLPQAGWLRLRKIARYYANICPLEPEDLLQTALTRALAGERLCPTHVDVVRFLAETMRSIASDNQKAQGREVAAQARQAALRVVQPVDSEDAELQVANLPSPEDVLSSKQEAARIKAAILRLFDGDLIAQTIVEGDMEEMTAEEIRALTDLDKVAYASKRRFIRRRIDQAFPQGWTP